MKAKGPSDESSRELSDLPLRQRYLLEKERIKQEIGDLEQIRHAIGLSKRRMCQLLLVDPSAWTRWTKSEAPPHIYQALRWLLELKKTNPSAADVPGSLDRRVDLLQARTESRLKQVESNLAAVERSVSFASTMMQAKLDALTSATAEPKKTAEPREPLEQRKSAKPVAKPRKKIKPRKKKVLKKAARAKKVKARPAAKRKTLPLKKASRYRRKHSRRS